MKFLDLLRLSSSSLWKRKVRTLLTVLGVTIGVASIVVMVSLGLGLNKSSMEEMESYGSLTAITVNEAGVMAILIPAALWCKALLPIKSRRKKGWTMSWWKH